MSTFLTKPDYTASIDPDVLDRLTDADDTLLDVVEDEAIEYMKGFLAARYDVDAVFANTGSARNPIVKKYALDIALLFLYQRADPEAIPEARIANYEMAEKWLVRVQKEEVSPPDLEVPADGVKDYVQHGSNGKRRNHLT